MKSFLGAAILAAALIGCGGGGSSSPTPPTNGTTPTLQAGFIAKGGGVVVTAKGFRSVRTQSATLGGALEPFAIFFVPDSYVPANAFPTIGYQAVAYLSGTAPNPLPTVTFAQTGPALQFISNDPNLGDATAPSGDTVVGIENVGAPATIGQSTVTAASAALGQSVNIVADTYAGTEISAASGSALNGPSGLTFTSAGAAVTAAGQTPDLSISVGSPTSFVAPGGIIETDVSMDSVSPSLFAGAPATTLPVSSVCAPTGPISFIFKTQGGLLVKLGEIGPYFNPYSTPAQGAACQWTDMVLTYQVANASGQFAY